MAKAPHPVIDWFGPQVGPDEKQRVLEVLDSNYLNDGRVTRQFEQAIAHTVGTRYCVCVTSGTAALALSLMALGIGPGDEVMVPDLTFIATANAARLAGAQVKLVDIDPSSLTIDPDQAAAAIGPRTRAIVPVDLNGRGAHYPTLQALAEKHGLKIVCDSTEALGSACHGQRLGSFGDAGCFSFSAVKTLTCGQGGAIVTNHASLHDRLRELKDQGRRVGGTGGGDDAHPVVGFNFKLTNLQAAVGLAQIERLPQRLSHARQKLGWYRANLEGCPGVTLPPTQDSEVLQWVDALAEDRQTVRQALDQARIGYRPFWQPLHTHPPYQAAPKHFPNATTAANQGLWLPSGFGLTAEQADWVCQTIRNAATGA